jgi:hypothetical protein
VSGLSGADDVVHNGIGPRPQLGVQSLGFEAKKTEHAGSKKGRGAFWGYKRDAKRQSNKVRRRADRESARVDERSAGSLDAVPDPLGADELPSHLSASD